VAWAGALSHLFDSGAGHTHYLIPAPMNQVSIGTQYPLLANKFCTLPLLQPGSCGEQHNIYPSLQCRGPRASEAAYLVLGFPASGCCSNPPVTVWWAANSTLACKHKAAAERLLNHSFSVRLSLRRRLSSWHATCMHMRHATHIYLTCCSQSLCSTALLAVLHSTCGAPCVGTDTMPWCIECTGAIGEWHSLHDEHTVPPPVRNFLRFLTVDACPRPTVVTIATFLSPRSAFPLWTHRDAITACA
jgi:hypothetical protein